MQALRAVLIIFSGLVGAALAIVLFLALLPFLALVSYLGGGLLALGAFYLVALGVIDLRRRWLYAHVIHLGEHGAYHLGALTPLHPASVHASRYRIVEASTNNPPALLPLPAPALPAPYDFLDELSTFRPSSDSIFLGRNSSGIITVAMSRLWHIALAGATGGGKTNILRLILAQLLKLGATCYLCDIHYAPNKRGMDWIPIAERLAAPPVRDIQDIYATVEWLARSELQARIDREYAGEFIGDPLYLAIEELPAVMAEKPEIAPHLSKLLRQGRQYDVCLIGATQDMLVKTLGTSGGVRECFRTGYYTGGDMTTARVLLDLQKGQAIDEDGLGVQGRVYLKTAIAAAMEVRVPLASNDAVYALLGSAGTSSVLRNSYRSIEKQPERPIESNVSLFPGAFPERNTPAQEVPVVSVSEAERRQITALAAAGVPRRDILKRMRWGGDKYALIKAVLDEAQ
jgi:hypothetical protein